MHTSPTFRVLLSILSGVAAGVLVMTVIQSFSPYQPPPGVTYTSGEPPYLQWVRSLTTQAWLIILASFLLASLVGGFVTNKITPPASFPPVLITGFMLLFFGIVKYLAFASPAWMTYVACTGCMVFALAGGWLAKAGSRQKIKT